jgi:hypothetical protein
MQQAWERRGMNNGIDWVTTGGEQIIIIIIITVIIP